MIRLSFCLLSFSMSSLQFARTVLHSQIYIPSYFFHQNACLYSYIVTYKF
ncbi:hypothetical protein POPTR_019G024466v4 [Populus trichocarpa]|uniref:Uncharacterized protein n=1 Tax=Populus trichocarpa TaxID=3694 RepID=A0ACC0RKR6_POPTR|nr:hypothetical protein POPTR_019G024466v4 [Populus trichocarpa]